MATHSSILAWRIPVDRGAWWATVHGVRKSQTQLSNEVQCSTESAVKNLPAMQEMWETWFDPWVWKTPWTRAWQPTPVFMPGESLWTEEPGGL